MLLTAGALVADSSGHSVVLKVSTSVVVLSTGLEDATGEVTEVVIAGADEVAGTDAL